MTQEASNGKEKKSSTMKFMLPVVVVILLVGGIGFVAKMDKGLDAHLVESELNNLIANAQQQYPATRVTYAGVEMAGGAADRHALVQDVRVVVDIVNEEREPAELEFAFSELKIQPKSVRFDAFDVTPTQGMVITEDGEVTVFAFDPAPTMQVKQAKESGGLNTQYELPLLGEWRILGGEEVAEGEEQPAVELHFGESSVVSGNVLMAPMRAGSLKMDISSINAKHTLEADEKLSIGALILDSSWKQTDEQRGAGSLRLDLADLFSTEEEMPYGAISVAIEGDYDGPMPDEEREIDWASEKALVDVRRFNIAAQDVALDGRLNFQTGRGELLPVGEGQIDIQNFAYVLAELRAHELLDDASEKLLGVLTQQVTGQKLDEITDLSLPVKRVDGGSLQIGQSNFEELFAIFLTGGKLHPSQGTPEAQEEAGEPMIDEGEVKELFNE